MGVRVLGSQLSNGEKNANIPESQITYCSINQFYVATGKGKINNPSEVFRQAYINAYNGKNSTMNQNDVMYL